MRRLEMHDAAAWPMDLEQLLAVFFRAEGFFVAILVDESEGRAAMMDLLDAGVLEDDLKLYTSEETLAIHERYVQRRGIGAKVAGVLMDDDAGRDLYLGYAEDGRCALWVRVPDKADVPSVLRAIADRVYLHARYYGKDGVRDVHLS
jgi:hypothetical protein